MYGHIYNRGQNFSQQLVRQKIFFLCNPLPQIRNLWGVYQGGTLALKDFLSERAHSYALMLMLAWQSPRGCRSPSVYKIQQFWIEIGKDVRKELLISHVGMPARTGCITAAVVFRLRHWVRHDHAQRL